LVFLKIINLNTFSNVSNKRPYFMINIEKYNDNGKTIKFSAKLFNLNSNTDSVMIENGNFEISN